MPQEPPYSTYANNDIAQVWGQGITPKVKGHGELPGESSLPFHEFVARLYAFHYNPYEQGDAYVVDNQYVENGEKLARESCTLGCKFNSIIPRGFFNTSPWNIFLTNFLLHNN
ncbi:hypothetical protein [Gracilibacillus thailandensis]|uniref:hypothetical protein n=1 Tax=Gracilibacillus thailandensis TaxID=563735 RepID=UPI00196A01AA|nr:hypothetical protein [Gracilibacillus thailandensis]